MLTFCRRHLTLVTILLCLSVYGVAATITNLGALPTNSGGAFTQDNLNQIQTNVTTANTNFANLNTALFGGITALTSAPAPAVAGAADIGSTTKPFGNLWFAGTSSTPATNNYEITGVATAGRVITFPDASISVVGGVASACGATTTCANTNATSIRVIIGSGQLSTGSPSTFVMTGISPAFTSASTFTCNAIDTTTAANNISVLTAGYVSGSAVTFTGPNTNTDTFRYSCVGT